MKLSSLDVAIILSIVGVISIVGVLLAFLVSIMRDAPTAEVEPAAVERSDDRPLVTRGREHSLGWGDGEFTEVTIHDPADGAFDQWCVIYTRRETGVAMHCVEVIRLEEHGP